MGLTLEQTAHAFSGHHFDDAVPYLAEDATWTIVGAEALTGKQAIVAMCVATTAHLSNVSTNFAQFKTISAEDCVVIDSVAEYTDPDGKKSIVASCDLFGFRAGQITQIRSYNIEL